MKSNKLEKLEKSTLDEIKALKVKFDLIKSHTEEFIESAKELSEKGASEAQDLIESAKKNWNSIVKSFDSSGLSKLFSKSKKKVTKKAPARKRS